MGIETSSENFKVSYPKVMQNQKSAGLRRRLTIPLLLIFSAANKRDKPVVLLQYRRRAAVLHAPVHLPHTRTGPGNGGGNRGANRDYALDKKGLMSRG